MMMPRKFETRRSLADRARRSAREIAIAVILTFAAIVFVVAAMTGGASEQASMTSQPGNGVEKSPN